MLKLPRFWERSKEAIASTDHLTINDLVGQTVVRTEKCPRYGDQLEFHLEDGRAFIWFHVQDCCEDVSIETSQVILTT